VQPETGVQASRWGPIAGLALVASANQMLWLNFTPITSGTAARLGVSKSAIGWLSEIFPLLYVVLAVPVGKALDRWFRSTLLLGGGLTAVGAVVRVTDHHYGVILAGQALIALGQPAVLNAITGTASRYLATGHRPVGIAIGSAGTFVGFVAAFVLGAGFGASGLPRILDVSAAYAGFALIVLAVSLTASLKGETGSTRMDDVELSSPAIRDLWQDKVVRTLSGLVFVGFGGFIALTTWVETLLKPAGVKSSTTDTLLTVMVVAGVAGCAVIPPAVANRRLQAPVILVSAVAAVVSGVLLAVIPGVPAGAIALPLVGLLLLPDLPIVLELAERRARHAAGAVTALLWLAGNAGGILVALVVQGLQSQPAAAFLVIGATGGVGIPLALRLGRQLQLEGSQPQAMLQVEL
jgi:predicted MFS family arabinose efflux permease